MTSRRFSVYVPLALAVLSAATLQLMLALRNPTISADGILFIAIARELPQSPAETFRRHDQHPGYPALLMLAERGVESLGYHADPEAWVLAGMAVTFVFGLATVVVVWLFSRELFDTRVANFAAFIFAVLPVPRTNASDAMSDTPHLFFYLLAAWLASKAIVHGRPALLAGAGAASGAAYWIRPEGLEVGLVALFCLSLQALRCRWSWRQWSVASGTLAAASLLVAAPYPILAGKITSKQIPLAKVDAKPTFIAQLATNTEVAAPSAPTPDVEPKAPADSAPPNDVAHSLANDAVLNSQTSPLAASAPADVPQHETARPTPAEDSTSPAPDKPRRKVYSASLVLRLVGQGFTRFINSICQGFKFLFIPFYLVGNYAMIRRHPQWMQIGFVALLATAHITILIGVYVMSGYIAHRHVLPLVALAMPFTAIGILWTGELLSRPLRLPPLVPAVAVLLVTCGIMVPYTTRVLNREFVPVIQAARWIQSRAPAGSGVLSNSPYAEFYGGLPSSYLGVDGLSVAESLANAKVKARYDFVVLHVNAHDYRPEWIEQLAPHFRQVGELIDPYPSNRPKKVLVYEAKDAQAVLGKLPQRS